jgi:hypothetical protein
MVVGTEMRFQDMTTQQRAGIAVVGAIEAALTLASLVDLARRPAGEIRGPKALWVPGVFVQPVGPLLYLLWGRRGG